MKKAFRLGDFKGEPRLAYLSLYYSTHLSTYLVRSRGRLSGGIFSLLVHRSLGGAVLRCEKKKVINNLIQLIPQVESD